MSSGRRGWGRGGEIGTKINRFFIPKLLAELDY